MACTYYKTTDYNDFFFCYAVLNTAQFATDNTSCNCNSLCAFRFCSTASV